MQTIKENKQNNFLAYYYDYYKINGMKFAYPYKVSWSIEAILTPIQIPSRF